MFALSARFGVTTVGWISSHREIQGAYHVNMLRKAIRNQICFWWRRPVFGSPPIRDQASSWLASAHRTARHPAVLSSCGLGSNIIPAGMLNC